jgi:hypothetical protein
VCAVMSVENRRRVENNNKAEMKEKQEEDEMWSVVFGQILARSFRLSKSSPLPFVCLRSVVKGRSPLSLISL